MSREQLWSGVLVSMLHTTKVTGSNLNTGRRWRGPEGLRGPEAGVTSGWIVRRETRGSFSGPT